MELPTGVLAYRLLKSMDISENKELARATMASFTYDDMKKQLKAIYDNLSTNEIKGSTTEIKVEPTYEVKTYEKSHRLDGYFSRGQSNAYRGSRGHSHNRFKKNNQTRDTRRQPNDSRRVNPPNQYGRVSRFVSQSIIGLKIVLIMLKAVIVKSLFSRKKYKNVMFKILLGKHLIWQF